MENFILKLKGGVKSAAKTAKRKTKQITETAELKIDIKLEESNREECFEKIGRLVYLKSKLEKNESKYDDKIAELIVRADKISEKITANKNRLAEIKGKEVCPRCEAVIDADYPCEYCNEKIVANEKLESEKLESEKLESEKLESEEMAVNESFAENSRGDKRENLDSDIEIFDDSEE